MKSLFGALTGSSRWLSGAALGAALSLSTPADACGGFFCSQVPVDQSGENILFAVEGETVTAHIQIFYNGEAEKFSWVLPLPAIPEIGVGTDALFTLLRGQTDPRFNLEWQNKENCWGGGGCRMMDAAAGGPPSANEDGDGGGVSVVAEGAVGPFDYKVVEATSGEVLFTWLNDNGYDQPEESKSIVGHYVNQKYVFLALKLQKDKAAGDIQPVVVKYNSSLLACVPLKLTSIAATPDMPVRSWILAGARAVPLNFFHVVLNEKAYPWLDCANNWGWWFGGGDPCAGAYEKMVTDAADAANGHAFVTEYAGPTALMDNLLYQDGKFDLAKLEGITEPMEFMQEMLNQGFPRSSLLQEVIRKWIPKPENLPAECQEDAAFYTWNIETCLGYMPEGWTFDPVGMAADLDERVIQPAKAAQALFDTHPYMTRFFTTVSPDEMTKDPMFSFNPDLPDVSNQHTVKATPICAEGQTQASSVEIEYGDGSKQIFPTGDPNSCEPPVIEGYLDNASPYAEIQILPESGEPQTISAADVHTREPEIDLATATPGQSAVKQNPAVAGTIDGKAGTFGAGETLVEVKPDTTSSGSTGCTGSGRSAPAGAGAFLLAGLALLGLRRRS